jgi:elongation factor 1-beta
LRDPTKMAQVVITLRIMPESPDIDLAKVEADSKKLIVKFGGEVGKVEINPVAFGLKAVDMFFVMDESKGSTEVLENEIANFDGIASVEVIDVRRAIG